MANAKIVKIFKDLGLDSSKADDFIDALKDAGISVGGPKSKHKSDTRKEIESIKNEMKAKSGISGLLFGDLREQKKEMKELHQDVVDAQNEYNEALNKYKKGQIEENDLKEVELELVKAESRELNHQIQARKEIKSGLVDILRTTKDFLGAWGKIDQSASRFSKSVGTSAVGMDKMRRNAIKNVTEGKFGINYGVGSEKMLELQQKYINNIGRNIQFSALDQESMAALNAVMGETGADFAEKLENFGLSYTDAANRAGKMFKDASKYGISLEKYSKNVLTNIKLAQNYKFKDGIKGLESMAKKATAMKLDMQQVASFADKVNTVEGAINTGAQLQVLGGPFARFADPLGMLNESLTNMEGLQDRFERMISGMAKYDNNKGEISISSFNQQRIRAAAQAMGMDYGQVIESAMAKGRANYIGKQIQGKYNKEEVELLKNIATVQNGTATVSYIDRNGRKKDVDLRNQILNGEELKLIKEQNQTQEEDIKSIAKMLRGWDDIMKGTEEQKKSAQASLVETMNLGKFVKNITSSVAHSNVLLTIIAASTAISGIANTIGGIRNGGFKNLFKNRGGGNIIPNISSPRGGTFSSSSDRASFLRNYDAGISGYKITNSKGLGKLGNASGRINKIISAGGASKLSFGKKILGSVGKFGSLSLAGGALSGLFTGIDEFSGNKNYGVGKKIGRTTGSAIGATIGTVLGGLAGPLGAIAGGIAGEALGKWAGGGFANQKRRARKKNEFGLTELEGDYSTKELKQIARGRISSKLEAKLEKNGELDIAKELIRRQNITSENIEAKINNATLIVNGLNAKSSTMAKGGLLSGPSHARGGMPILGSNIEVEGGEFVVNKKSAAKNIEILRAINQMGNGGIIKPREMSRGGSIQVIPSSSETSLALQRNGFGVQPIGPQEININIGGTIKLEGANGKQADITEELLKDPQFIRNITRLIESQMGTNISGGKVINKGLY